MTVLGHFLVSIKLTTCIRGVPDKGINGSNIGMIFHRLP